MKLGEMFSGNKKTQQEAVAKQATPAQDKPKKEQKPPVQKKIEKLLYNASPVPQIIGAIELEPGMAERIDVTPGTLGALLLQQGVLSETRKPVAKLEFEPNTIEIECDLPNIKVASSVETICPHCNMPIVVNIESA